MKVALGADHAGFQLKDALKRVLDELGIAYEDFGTTSSDSVDYPDFAAAVAGGVAQGAFTRGILVCGSGIGMAIAANKISGIRAAVVADVESARLSRRHNDANILALGARLVPETRAAEIVRAFLCTDFEGGRHSARLDKIQHIELRPQAPDTGLRPRAPGPRYRPQAPGPRPQVQESGPGPQAPGKESGSGPQAPDTGLRPRAPGPR